MPEYLLQVQGIEKSFSDGNRPIPVLRGIDLLLRAGESLAIQGASGSGKSTLLSVIGGLERPDAGQILFRGGRLDHGDQAALSEYRSRRVGFVFQFHHLIREFSAEENVALPAMMAGLSRKAAIALARELLDSLGLHERWRHLPSALSGGERQRTAMARALVNEPALLIADEPTGNLDPATAAQVIEIIYQLPAKFGSALLLATHDPRLSSPAGQRATLREGRLEAC